MFRIFQSRKTQSDLPSFNCPDDSSLFSSEDIHLPKKIKHGNAGQVACGVFEEYCSYSTIHGTKYLGEPKRHWLEKTWWIIAFAFSLLGCGSLIMNVYVKWDRSPVIVSFAEKSTPVWEIPFPSITICPETKVANKTMLNFSNVYLEMIARMHPPYNISDKELEYMEAVSQICDAHLTAGFEIGENFTDNKIIDLLREVAPTFNETMKMCKFRNTFEYCDSYFEEIITDEGLCFTFNMLNSKELYTDKISKDFLTIKHKMTSTWNLESGYKVNDTDAQTYPYRVFRSGARVGLFVLLKQYEQSLEYICRGPVQGFKVLLHTPGEVPQVSKHYFRVPLLQELLVAVEPNMVTTSEGLLNYEPNRRQCYFSSERQLRFFRVYTQRNCELECLANFTLSECGCVKFSMPRDDQTPICGSAKIACYNDAEDNLLKKQSRAEFMAGKYEKLDECNCLPGCTSIVYNAEISQAPFDFVDVYKAYRIPLDAGMQPARLAVFFKENQFITSRRSELYGPTDFIANCGGLLGLFMGVSLLSIVEIIYHVSLRLCCNLRNRIKHKNRSKVSVKPLDVSGAVMLNVVDDEKTQ